MNFSAKYPPHRQAENRYVPLKKTAPNETDSIIFPDFIDF